MEALAVIFVFIVALAIFAFTWISTLNAPARSRTETLDELEAYRDTLRKTALRAQLERWDGQMMGQIADKLDEVERRIAQTANQG